jgi:hypothetical protein
MSFQGDEADAVGCLGEGIFCVTGNGYIQVEVSLACCIAGTYDQEAAIKLAFLPTIHSGRLYCVDKGLKTARKVGILVEDIRGNETQQRLRRTYSLHYPPIHARHIPETGVDRISRNLKCGRRIAELEENAVRKRREDVPRVIRIECPFWME